MLPELAAISRERGESLSLIVREAVGEYLAKRTGRPKEGAIKKTSSG
jgi:hypothetical protein